MKSQYRVHLCVEEHDIDAGVYRDVSTEVLGSIGTTIAAFQSRIDARLFAEKIFFKACRAHVYNEGVVPEGSWKKMKRG